VRNFQRNFLNPLAVSLLGVAVLYGSGIRHVVALISLSICLFTFSTIVLEFYRGTRARRASTGGTTLQALGSLMTRNRRRYGGYIVHFGVVLIFLGITGSSAYKIERDIVLAPMEEATVGDFTLRYETLERDLLPTHESLKARVAVSRGGRQVTTLYPERRFYFAQNQPTTEVALRTTLLEDLYIILAGFEPSGTATFKVFVNPLVAWLWLGGLVLIFGTLTAVWPERRRPAGVYAPGSSTVGATENKR
jgi:cytochrome c-type biogenesis protein CcmF